MLGLRPQPPMGGGQTSIYSSPALIFHLSHLPLNIGAHKLYFSAPNPTLLMVAEVHDGVDVYVDWKIY